MAKNALSDLLAQKAALDKQIADMQRKERSGAIGQVKAMMAQYGLTLADISGSNGSNAVATSKPAAAAPKRKGPGKNAGKKVAAKYRNAATGDSWSGRGLKPRWLTAAMANGRQLADFAV